MIECYCYINPILLTLYQRKNLLSRECQVFDYLLTEDMGDMGDMGIMGGIN